MKRKIFLAVVIAACVAAAIYGFTRGFDPSLFLASLWEIHPWWLAASIVMTLATYVTRAYRWRVLLKPVRAVGIPHLLEATLVGFSTIFVLGRAGEIARPIWLSRRAKVPFSASVATLVAERFLDMICLVALFAWALMTVEVSPESAGALASIKAPWVLLAASIAGVMALIIFSRYPQPVLRLIPFARVRSVAETFVQGLASLSDWRSLAASVVYSLMTWIGILLQFWFLLLSMKLDLTAPAATLVLVGTAIGSLVQLPGIGGGFQVAFMLCLTKFFSVPGEKATAAALVAWVTSYAPTIACTAVYMMFSGVQMSDLRSALRREQAASASGDGV